MSPLFNLTQNARMDVLTIATHTQQLIIQPIKPSQERPRFECRWWSVSSAAPTAGAWRRRKTQEEEGTFTQKQRLR